MLNIVQDDITDTDTDPSERSAMATCLEYGHRNFDITDGMRREELRIRSTGRVSAVSINGLILPPEEDCLSGKEMSLEDVRSEAYNQRRPDGGEARTRGLGSWTRWTWSQCVELCHVSCT